MSVPAKTAKLTSHALDVVAKIVESDTDATTVDLNLLENLNTNQSLNYIKLEQSLSSIDASSRKLEIMSMFKL